MPTDLDAFPAVRDNEEARQFVTGVARSMFFTWQMLHLQERMAGRTAIEELHKEHPQICDAAIIHLLQIYMFG